MFKQIEDKDAQTQQCEYCSKELKAKYFSEIFDYEGYVAKNNVFYFYSHSSHA